ncbi:DUF411 domain-containing protein [Neptuniibacter halophilus]|uniref:DUF411 domain-containing protein n=1 Tax=Neptuniibacter halophilus TaxID=651666 RepID=UPI00257326FC|nr:DUF411 domain-containing protein [Neptuniibacter halophilus]
MIKKNFLLCLSLLPLPLLAGDPYWQQGKDLREFEIEVYRSASCGCCKDWISHLQAHNFRVLDRVVEDVTPIKQQHAVPQQGYSCHTALINGKVIEGHVPAQAIKAALAQPEIRLLTVPGMVSGSPGMDSPGAPHQAFKVYSVDQQGQVEVYREYSDY